MANNKELIGKYVQFTGCPNMLYKVLDEHNKSILVEDDMGTYWERKEYIEYIFDEFANLEKFVRRGYYGIK